MTVCIAAACDLGEPDGSKIVVCADTLLSGALGKAQHRLKNRILAPGWSALTAGDETDMNAVVQLLQARFIPPAIEKKKNGKPWQQSDVVELVRSALAARKREIAEEMSRAQFAVAYDDLLKNGLQWLPSDIYRDAIWSIKERKIGAEFIIYGFRDKGSPLLVQTTSAGAVEVHEDFAVIGAGCYLAQSVLMHREHVDSNTLAKTIYTVFEAKKYAEGETSVGDRTHMMVWRPNGSRLMMREEGFEQLLDYYDQFGPQTINSLELKKSLSEDSIWHELNRTKEADN